MAHRERESWQRPGLVGRPETRKLHAHAKARTAQKVPINDRATLSKSLQFLDPLTLDKPKGSWSLKHDAGNKMVLLRSLVFPGYVHFNCTGSSMYGGIYNGAGARNLDLPFML